MNHADICAIRDRLIEDAKVAENPQVALAVDRFLSEFVHQIRDEMSRTETIFYQP